MRGKSFSLVLLLFLGGLLPVRGTEAEPIVKVVNGRVKEVSFTKQELILSYHHPVSGEEKDLTLKVDHATGFNEGVHLEDFKEGEPVSVDYEENPGGSFRAVQVKRVAVKGVPDEIAQFRR